MAQHNVPPEVQRLLELLVGNDWPEGNEGDLRNMAAAWHELAAKLSGQVTGDVQAAAGQAADGIGGATRDAFLAYADSVAGPNGYLASLASTANALGDACEQMALEIETLRIIIIESLILLAAQIAADVAAAAFTFGASATLIGPEMVATRVAIVTAIRSAVIRLTSHLVESVANQVVMTFLAQLIEMAQHRRKSFDGGQIALAAKNGAIGGAVGFGMGNLGGLAKSGLGRIGSHIPVPNAFAHVPPTLPRGASGGGKVILASGWGAVSGAAESAAQDAAAGSFGDQIPGAENGAFSGALGRFHSGINPGGKFSLSIGDHLNEKLNSLLGPKDQGTVPTPVPSRTPTPVPTPTPSRTSTPEPIAGREPPVLPPLPPSEDWGAWTHGIVGSPAFRPLDLGGPQHVPTPTPTPQTTSTLTPTFTPTPRPLPRLVSSTPVLPPLPPPEDWSGWADGLLQPANNATAVPGNKNGP
jgi:hypothetical protein